MSQITSSDGEVDWEHLNCKVDEYVENNDDTYYDDSKPSVIQDDGIDTIEDYAPGSFSYDAERDDPLRNEGVPEEQIAKGAMDAFLKVPGIDQQASLEKARILTSKILQVSDVAFSDHLPAPTEQAMEAQIMNHGLDSAISKQLSRGIAPFGFIKAIALLHHVCIYPASFDIPKTYTMCVRAVNALSHLLVNPKIAEKGGTELVNILEKVWDISVLLLGATRTRAQLVGDNYLQIQDLNFLHAQHYRKGVKDAMKPSLNEGSVCRKTLAHLTREEMPPFIRPQELLDKIKDMHSGTSMHDNCTEDSCIPDKDAKQQPPYHSPGCSGNCPMVAPPKESIPLFDSILSSQRRMPAVRAYSYVDKRKWWVPVTRKTMAISHLWRDGISGTRDNGMNHCLHQLFSQLAQERGLDSYWIDCATIPEHPRQRRLMIQQINSTFHIAGFTLCMDVRIARMKLPNISLDEDRDSSTTHHHDEKFLLAAMTSFWHSRAWTLLEGHKASGIVFYRESGQHLNLKEALSRVLVDEQTKTPLWIRACLAEFEAYMADGLTPEAAGMLLATRAASRKGDAELIWRLLTQPYTTRVASQALNSSPWDFSDTADLAFICSNAERSTLPGLCWMPSQANVTTWARRAYGGHKADIVRTTNVHLHGKWYVKHGKSTDIEDIDLKLPVNHSPAVKHLMWKLDSKTFEFIFAQPVLVGDQGRPDPCKRVIVMTRPCHAYHSFGQNLLDPLWHWEAMVELRGEQQFRSEDIMSLNIGFDYQASAPPVTQVLESLRSRSLLRWLQPNYFLLNKFSFLLASILLATLFTQCVAAGKPEERHVDTSGTLNLSYVPFLPPQNIPTIVFEWAALVPLLIYLANSRSHYDLAGEVSLRGRLSVSFIPKLFALGGLANLLEIGEVFFDSANNEGETFKVFDVQHGNSFRCYNSAAASLVAKAAFDGHYNSHPDISEVHLNNWMGTNRKCLEDEFNVAKFGDVQGSQFEEIRENRKIYGRSQVLNVIHVMSRRSLDDKGDGGCRRRGIRGIGLRKNWDGNIASSVQLVLTIGLAALLYTTGCLGSGSLVFIGGVSRFCAQKTVLDRPPSYLRNRENYGTGCMLVAVHENAAVWTLYYGERGLIDALLNKPMIDHLKPSRSRVFIYNWFRFAEGLQVIAMTFVAGQKGWDSIVLLLLITVVGGFSKLYGYNMHAKSWLDREGYKTDAFQCVFPGRTELMAAVQTLSTEKQTHWMDEIISPIPRREVLLNRLGIVDCKTPQKSFDELEEIDKVWVMSNFIQAKTASVLIGERLRRSSVSP